MIKDLTHDSSRHQIGKGTFAFAVRLTGPNPELLLDTSYFRFSANNAKYSRDSNFALSKSFNEIEMEICGDNFPYDDQDVYKRSGLSLFLCPKNNDYFLQSNFNSDEFYTIEIFIQKCNSGCQSDADIENVLNSHFLELALINSYFDFEDYKNPIKTYLEDINFFGLVADHMTVALYERVIQSSFSSTFLQ